MNLKRSTKSAALGLVARSGSPDTDPVSRAALRAMRIEMRDGSPQGYASGAKGACCISVDFDVTDPSRYDPNRAGTAALLRLSERYGVPLTWAICGKTAEEDPRAYESIIRSSLPQELGVHTYSHIYADETPEAAYEEDIRRCLGVLGLSSAPPAFVFPKNREGHFGLLRRLGFACYRSKWRAIGRPSAENGLWNISPVFYFDQRSIGADSLMKRFVDACIARSAVFHLWTHPWSLASPGASTEAAEATLEPVFAYLKEKSQSGLLSLTTMGGLSRFLGPTGATA